MRSPFQWARASVQGASHKSCGATCQDAFALRLVRSTDTTSYFIGAVTDGAGSSKHAAKAAVVAANVFVQAAAELIEHSPASTLDSQQAARAAAEHARSILLRLAKRSGDHPDEYATTLLGCITSGYETAVLQIGDGAIVLGPAWHVAFKPQRGRFANIASFLTDDNALDVMATRTFSSPFKTITLMTDGIEPMLVNEACVSVHPPVFEHFERVFAHVRHGGHVKALSAQVSALLSGAQVQQSIGDDATLLTLGFKEGLDQ